MLTYHAYAAPSAEAPLEPFSFDPGPLGSEEVEIKVAYCGLCHSDLSMLDNATLVNQPGSGRFRHRTTPLIASIR